MTNIIAIASRGGFLNSATTKVISSIFVISALLSCKNIENEGFDSGGGGGGNLDCSTLDPSKVYMVGRIAPGQEGTPVTALADPEAGSSAFCIGFPGGETDSGTTVSPQGQYIYGSAPNLYAMVSDEFEEDGNNLAYPATPETNDTLVLTSTNPGCTQFLRISFNPTSDNFFYTCGSNDVIHARDQEDYFDVNQTPKLLAVLPDDSLLVSYQDGDLEVVRPDLSIAPLAVPNTGLVLSRYESTKFDAASASETLWIVVVYAEAGDVSFGRWALDVSSLEITDEGLFSAGVDGVSPTGAAAVLDGDGYLYRLGTTADPQAGVVMRMALESLSEESQIIFSDQGWQDVGGTWQEGGTPFVVLSGFSGTKLVTGP